MKTLALLATSLTFLLPHASLPAQQPAPAAEPEVPALASRITAVTVFADRARVTREAAVDLPAESKRFTFSKLPSWIDEGSVRVSLRPEEGAEGEVLDVQIRRTYLAAAPDAEVRAAQEAVQEINDQVNALTDREQVISQRRKHLETMRVFALDKLPKDVASREVKVAEYEGFLEFLATALTQLNADKRTLEKERRELQPELNVRQKRLNDLNSRAQLEERAVEVSLQGTGQGTLVLSYLLAGASWEPAHELRAETAGASAAITSHAVVRQTTGEDWKAAKLSFSTQNLGKTARIPELDSLLVGPGKKAPARLLAQTDDTFGQALGNYKGQNRLWYFNNPVDNNDVAIRNLDANGFIQQKAVQTFAKLSERGTTAHFRALVDKPVPTDGQPVRLPIGELTVPRVERIVAAPEVSANAARVFDLDNKSAQALLPGKVTLFLGPNFLGSTEIEFVGPGESFSLYAGVDDQVKVSRALDRSKSEMRRTRFSSKTELEAVWNIQIENLSDLPKNVRLADRIPLSQTDDVKVRSVKISPKAAPDEKGLFSWDLALAPKETRALSVEYVVSYPREFTTRQTSTKSGSSFDFDTEASPSAPASSLRGQLQSLERMF